MSRSRSETRAEESPELPKSVPPPPSRPPLPTRVSLFAPIPSSPPETSGPAEASPLPQEPGPDWSTSEPSAPDSAPAEPSATPSTGDLRVSKAGIRAAIGQGFRTGCRMFASFAASQEEREHGVWVPDDEDVQDVSKPAANIVYRRLPDEAKGGDLIDIVSLGLAVVGYVAKNLQRRAEVRTLYALQSAAGGEGPAEEPAP